jgi:hypothetical protein
MGTTPHGLEIIYTCPGKTEGFDGYDPHFVNYFDEHLRVIEQKPWIWVFDCSDYSLRHMVSLENLRSLVNYLYESHSKRLQATYILHMGWAFQSIFTLVMPLLKQETRKRIHILSSKHTEAFLALETGGFSPNQIAQLLKSSS